MSSNEQKVTRKVQKVTSNEQKVTRNEQNNNEQRAKSFTSVAGSFIQEMNQTSGNKKLLFTYLPFFRVF